MESIRSLKNLKNKKVLVRVDFNVPIKNKKVLDDFRIQQALPTIKFLLQKKAEVFLITHLGKDGQDNLNPVIQHFFKISKISNNKVKFLENIRKFKGEMKNDFKLAQSLAQGFDFFVNEAFSVSHRQHASVVAITKYLPSYAGFNLEAEVKNLSIISQKTQQPFLFILGGAKFSSKLPLLKKYLKLADFVFIGGALANDFLKEQGHQIGKSLTDNTKIQKNILKNQKLILPIDVVVKSKNKLLNKKVNEIKKDEIILDIGQESIKIIETYVQKAKLILWNGPLGKYEAGGDKATIKILNLIGNSKAKSIIGGGDTVALITKLKIKDKFTFISTGGGATLDFLVHGNLPGIKALNRKN